MEIDKITSIYVPPLSPGALALDRSSQGLHICACFLNNNNIIISDLCGPFETSTGGYKYFITWIDLKTCYASIKFLRNKECTTVTDSFRHYITWISRQKNANVKKIWSNDGGEYTGREFSELCNKLSIIHEMTTPYTPEHNSVTERYNRTLQEGALTLQHDSKLTNRFWVSAIHMVRSSL